MREEKGKKPLCPAPCLKNKKTTPKKASPKFCPLSFVFSKKSAPKFRSRKDP
jgi:hypothetical protein